MQSLRRIIRFYRIFDKCEKYRIEEERKRKEAHKEQKIKDRQEWMILQKEDDSSEEAESEEALIIRLLRPVVSNIGGILVIIFLLFVAGAIRGRFQSTEEEIADTFKVLYLMYAFLIVVQSVPSIIYRLYREENLPYLMTMPCQPADLVGAKFLQGIKLPYKIMLIGFLPIFLGCSFTHGFHKGLTLSVLMAIICIPGFVLLLLFMVVILLFTYRRMLVPRNPVVSISVPAVAVVLTGGVLTLLEILLPGSPLAKVLNVLADILVFNFALKRMACGQIILPFLVIVLGMILTGMLFFYTVSYLYQKSLLHRWDLADDKPIRDMDYGKVEVSHGFWMAMILRELRTIKGLRVFRISNCLSLLLTPLILLMTDILLVNFIPVFSVNKEMSAVRVLAFLVGNIVPMTLLPGFLNRATGTAFSRDAYSYRMLFMIPIEVESLLWAKLFATVLYCAVGSTPYLLLGGVLLLVDGKLPFWALLTGLLLHIILLVWVAEVKLMRDIRNMNLKWERPAELLEEREGMPLMLGILAGILVPMILGFVLYLTVKTTWKCLAWIFFIAVAMAMVGYFNLFLSGLPKLYDLEDGEN